MKIERCLKGYKLIKFYFHFLGHGYEYIESEIEVGSEFKTEPAYSEEAPSIPAKVTTCKYMNLFKNLF